MHTIYLDRWHDCPLTISDEGHEHLSRLVFQYLVCEVCEHPYSEQTPQVGKNFCLSCLLMRQKELTYVGPSDADEKGRTTFKFLDQEGFVYLSAVGYSEQAHKSVFQTFLHWDFPVPTVYTTAQGDLPLHRSEWKIHGNLATASVIVAEYCGTRTRAVFLSYKGETYKELSKRDGEMKHLLQRAREAIEATRDQQGMYHAGNHPTHSIFESHIYAVVSAMESALYNVQLQIRSKKPAEAEPAQTEDAIAS
jgi:hypothetical protein